MVAKVRFWLLEISRSIANASLSVMIDTEVTIPIFFVYNWAMFHKELGNTSFMVS